MQHSAPMHFNYNKYQKNHKPMVKKFDETLEESTATKSFTIESNQIQPIEVILSITPYSKSLRK